MNKKCIINKFDFLATEDWNSMTPMLKKMVRLNGVGQLEFGELRIQWIGKRRFLIYVNFY